MSRAQITLSGKYDRERAVEWIWQGKPGTRVIFKDPKRSTGQNDKMWVMLTEVATQIPWHGQKLTPDDWKLLFLDALKRELRVAPNLDGNGFVNLGRSSSNLSKADFSDLLELIASFGARHGVVFHDQESSWTATFSSPSSPSQSLPASPSASSSETMTETESA